MDVVLVLQCGEVQAKEDCGVKECMAQSIAARIVNKKEKVQSNKLSSRKVVKLHAEDRRCSCHL